ncbi:hypothetical protein [Halothermothrix orenii]|uniref:Uncharacterized protein n=1 Tax=Halothermothrix orenii (strain H 168 / OCM 544 / DSM 9562) TaxID=373903 RepID=B8CYX0_HALOH|nr:hypothetical protein [Halothermothrix orenii]ACL70489.1 hypothetical protein Hore_17400 [Halothermothrix orenii H 168]
MGDRYLIRIIKQNWKFIVVMMIVIIIGGIIIKNVAEIPYENKHKMETRLPVEFEYNNQTIKGFIYVVYWVETDPEVVGDMVVNELERYLVKNGSINLNPLKNQFIRTLKSYSIKEIKNKCYSERQFFELRDDYYMDNDPVLKKIVTGNRFSIPFKYEIKKVFFVYLEDYFKID